MPVKRRAPKLRKTDWEGVTPEALAWLRGEDALWEFADAPPTLDLEEFYAEHADRLVAEHIETRPGTRPALWWRFMAPEPRRRLGGVGELRADMPSLAFGIPASHCWRWPGQTEYDRRVQRQAVDPSDPPSFESQAAYLRRHGLLRALEERKRLTDADFAPERVARGRG